MKKFDADEVRRLAALESAGGVPVLRLVTPGAPLTASVAQLDQLRALVRFAIGQGYYEPWNSDADLGVRRCSSTDFPTDRGSVSR
jgi:hypothetical protein